MTNPTHFRLVLPVLFAVACGEPSDLSLAALDSAIPDVMDTIDAIPLEPDTGFDTLHALDDSRAASHDVPETDALSDTSPSFDVSDLAEGDAVEVEAIDGNTVTPDGGADAGESELHSGTPLDPIPIESFPFVVESDSIEAPSDILDRYDCASADESGAEIVYRFELSSPAEFVAEVKENEGVDVDLHLLDEAPPLERSSSVACLERANTRLTTSLPAGTYWLVVDTYVNASGPRAGSYRLAVEVGVVDAWQIVTLGPGLIWKKKIYSNYAGGRQTINVLEIDPLTSGMKLIPYLKRGGGCIRPSTTAPLQGAVAAINVGFFDTGPGTCPALDLVKAHGEVLAYNTLTGAPQRSFGWTSEGETLVDWVGANRDWPSAYHAIGTYPSLVTGGEVRLEPDKDSSFFDYRHNRTAIGRTADGRILLVTVDGRTSAGAGMTLAALAQYMVSLGAVDAANLDGGGSTTMWIANQSINGIVNFPSDNATADHWGERAVSDILLVVPD